MVERVQEPIEVLSRFVEGTVQPVRFRWRGRVFTVSRISSAWQRKEGERREHFFSVGAGSREQYELSYRPETSQWTLESVYTETDGSTRVAEARTTRTPPRTPPRTKGGRTP